MLVPPSFERLTKWTDNDPEQCQPRTVHGLRRLVLKKPLAGELSCQQQAQCPFLRCITWQRVVGNPGSCSAGLETFLAGIAQFSSALMEEDPGHLSHKLVIELD